MRVAVLGGNKLLQTLRARNKTVVECKAETAGVRRGGWGRSTIQQCTRDETVSVVVAKHNLNYCHCKRIIQLPRSVGATWWLIGKTRNTSVHFLCWEWNEIIHSSSQSA